MSVGDALRTDRPLHPVAWWLWAGALAAAVLRTTNPVLLGAAGAVVALVVAACRTSAPWARAFPGFVKLAVAVLLFRLGMQVFFGRPLPGHVLFRLPELRLPSWAASVRVGGAVTRESLVGALYDGLRLSMLFVCFGAANTLASPYRLLRCLPASLYEAGVAVTVALSFAPQAVLSVGRVHQARRLRGRPTRGIAAVRGIAVPVLEGALDRSVELAASMDARGFGRTGGAGGSGSGAGSGGGGQRAGTLLALGGALAACIGAYGALDGAGAWWWPPALGSGAAALAASLVLAGRRSIRSRYRPDPWRLPEWAVTASAGVPLAAFLLAGSGVLRPSVRPLVVPPVPAALLIAVLVAAAPALLLGRATAVPSGVPGGRP